MEKLKHLNWDCRKDEENFPSVLPIAKVHPYQELGVKLGGLLFMSQECCLILVNSSMTSFTKRGQMMHTSLDGTTPEAAGGVIICTWHLSAEREAQTSPPLDTLIQRNLILGNFSIWKHPKLPCCLFSCIATAYCDLSFSPCRNMTTSSAMTTLLADVKTNSSARKVLRVQLCPNALTALWNTEVIC